MYTADLTVMLPNSGPRQHNGFTLLEVVVAMAIVGLGVVTLLELFSLNLRLGLRSAERTEAVALARQEMDRVSIDREIREGKESGSSDRGGRWSLAVESFEEESGSLTSDQWELKEITLEWQYGDGSNNRKFEMKTLRLLRKERP